MSELNPPKIIATDGIAQIEGFVNGNETLKPVDLIVKGSLPSWLKGELFTV
ncbi:2597_t:CDS:2, partial [Dentiscutata erythropus]